MRIVLLLLAALGLPGQDTGVLMRPKALQRAAPESPAQLREHFRNPPAEFRTMPLWVWNDLLEWPRLREQLAQFHEQGFGGVFIHPRPGLMTEYLGADWMRLWKQSVAEGKRLGLQVNIYDENSYPAGFAGGHVPSRAPDTAVQFVQAETDLAANAVRRGGALASFAVEKAGDAVTSYRRVSAASDVPKGQSVVTFRLRRASGNPWTAEFPYVDLTNPQTATTFLDTTYEAYKKLVGDEFGNTVRWAFNDEPLLAAGGAYDNARLALPLSFNTLAEFRRRNGYDLAEQLPALFWDAGDFRKVRFDYWQTLHDLWKENYMRPMFLWCDRNNLQWTGHWMEHEWPYPWITPDDASLYAYQHAPGIDMLEGTNLRLQGKDPHMLFTIKQVASVAHQLGRRAFCEAFGVGGWDGTLEHYKRFGDWLMVHGINFIDQHLAFSTVRGARKRDHPQSFTDVSPWWPYYRTHADHLARVMFLASHGGSRNRVLILEQTTSGFLLARRGAPTPELAAMRQRNSDMNQFLADHQVDYDLGDEYMVEWFGGQDGRQFVIGKAAYDLVVLPPDMLNLRNQTVPKLERYLASGGEILALSPPPDYIDGRPDARVKQLRERYAKQWHELDSPAALLAGIRQRLKPRIALDTDLPNVGVLDRYLPNGDRMLFLANTGLSGARSHAAVEGASLEAWDTVSGEMRPASYTVQNGSLRFDVDLAPAGSMLLVVKKTAGKAAPAEEKRFAPIDAGPWRVRADAPNVLVLDYCDVKIANDVQRDVNTWQANWNIWQRHGFERPAWDNAVQFRTRIFDRNHFRPDSGFEATFRFDVAEAAAHGLELGVEAPELYRIAVNGTPVDFGAGERWLDPHIRSVNIEKLVRRGENSVTVGARPFDVKMELENIYLRGAFRVEPAAKGYRLIAPGTLDFGPWSKQGYAFYGGAVSYETEATVPAGSNRLRVELGRWQGSVAAVLLDGKQVAVIGWQPYAAEFAATPGRHSLTVRVVSTPRNTFGPFHNPQKPRMRAWPAAWAEFPEHQPAGAEYDILEYGLMEPPAILTVRP